MKIQWQFFFLLHGSTKGICLHAPWLLPLCPWNAPEKKLSKMEHTGLNHLYKLRIKILCDIIPQFSMYWFVHCMICILIFYSSLVVCWLLYKYRPHTNPTTNKQTNVSVCLLWGLFVCYGVCVQYLSLGQVYYKCIVIVSTQHPGPISTHWSTGFSWRTYVQSVFTEHLSESSSAIEWFKTP